MDKKSKTYLVVFSLLVIGSVVATFIRIFILKDYVIESQIDCDPAKDACFIWECTPDAVDETERCTGDPDNDIWYYQLAERSASHVPLCDPNDETCHPFDCPLEEPECGFTYCDEETSQQQEAECSNPVDFQESETDESMDVESSGDEMEEGIEQPQNEASSTASSSEEATTTEEE